MPTSRPLPLPFHLPRAVPCMVFDEQRCKAIELDGEVRGRHRPLSTVEGLTSKPLFIPRPTVVRQPKCQWVRSYLQACFLCPLFHGGTLPEKRAFSLSARGFFPVWGENSMLLLLFFFLFKRTKWIRRLFSPSIASPSFCFFSSAQTAFPWQPRLVTLGLAHLLTAFFFFFTHYT